MNVHIMIDLETLGNSPVSPFFEAAAVAFYQDPEDKKLYVFKDGDKSFQRTWAIKPSQAEMVGANPDTIAWWLEQTQAARQNAVDNLKRGVPTPQFLNEFATFIKSVEKIADSRIAGFWSKGADFDLAILRVAYDRFKIPSPLFYPASRCVRTFLSLGSLPKSAPTHAALDDCYLQIAQMMEVCIQKNIQI